MIEIYTDGSSTKHRSGWGFVAFWDLTCGSPICEAGQENGATNQRMELMAALKALEWWQEFTDASQIYEDVTIYSDSAYLYNCYTAKWWVNWECNGWRNARNEPVANQDLWEQLIVYFKNPQVKIEKVKGHSGHTYNEWADKLATGALSPLNSNNLTRDEKNDKINIELSEILLDYSLKKYPVDEIIKRIRKACNCG